MHGSLGANERDPFVSPMELEKQKAKKQISLRMDLSEFVLNGILWNEKVGVAIINDEIFSVGDECKGLEVEAIERNSVTLTDGTDSLKLAVVDELPVFQKTSSMETGSKKNVRKEGAGPWEEMVEQELMPPQEVGGYPEHGL
ncbi:MAG: hypothetical protein ABIG31_01655 [Candidatus Omnitrophota bacterium]